MRPVLLVTSIVVGHAFAGCVRAPQMATDAPDDAVPAGPAVIEHQVQVADDEPPPVLARRIATDEVPPDPVRFQIGAGYGALSRLDLDACRTRGLPAGYLRVRATFARLGFVVRASVASEAAPPSSALDCIADGLRQAGVPKFDGEEARLSRTYFVAPSGSANTP